MILGDHMNETIGAKGSKNDYRRMIVIKEKATKNLKKFQEDQEDKRIKELEKKVKNDQILIFLKILPIITIGTLLDTLYGKTRQQQKIAKLEKIKEHIEKSGLYSEKETDQISKVIEQKISVLKDRKPKEDKEDTFYIEALKEEILEINLDQNTTLQMHSSKVKEKIDPNRLITKEELAKINTKQEVPDKIKEKLKGQSKVEVKEVTQEKIPIKESKLEKDNAEKINQLKNNKIVEEYDKKLKDARLELRNLIFEYNTLVDESKNLYTSESAEELLEKLNLIIKKMEELKEKISLPDIDQYDANYLYTLIEDDMKEFSDKKIVDEIKDSNLYILISEKLEELDQKKDDLSNEIEDRKEKLEIDEERFEEIKAEYFNYDNFNNELLKFQNEQDRILREVNEKLARAQTEKQVVEMKMQGIRNQNRLVRYLVATSMMIPGARSAQGIATTVLTSLYFIKTMLNPKLKKKKYKTIKIEDYHQDIEYNINKLEDISSLLKRTTTEIDNLINEIKTEYQEYLNEIPECREILADLEQIKEEIKEKEYELESIRIAQERNLEKNDAKVKKMV